MRLIFGQAVRRAAGLAVLLFFTVPFGLSVIGCGHKAAAVQYCNGGDSGPVVGQLTSLELSPTLAVYGESLNYGQIGQGLSATGYDCKGSVVSLSHIIYASTDMSFADINPGSGQVCGGTWNRNTGGNIADYTLCTAPNYTTAQQQAEHLAYVTGTSDGITSNAVPVYVHSTITSIQFGVDPLYANATQAVRCTNSPDTTCCPADPNTVLTNRQLYDGTSCISQNDTRQIAARIYAGTQNITCQAGHLNYGTQGTSGIVTLDQNGVATAVQPGSTTITAQLANSSSASNIGFFSTCPPTSITITPVGQPSSTGSINVGLYNSQPFTTTAIDQNQTSLTGLNLTFLSSNTQLVPISAGTVTPAYPGTATVVAACLPPSCNPSSADQIGLNGNGKPITSNGVTVTAAGTSTTAIYIASTDSQYVLPIDFSTGNTGSLVKLPFVPNSMAIGLDGGTVYFGSDQGLMTLTTATNSVSAANQLIPGTVVSVSPDGSTAVVTDPTRQVIELVSGSNVTTSYGGVATHAAWSTDGGTVYITTLASGTNGGYLLTHSTASNWQKTPINGPSGNATQSQDTSYNDVTIMVPSIGAYFAGNITTDGRSYCPRTTTANATVTPPVESNVYAPIADVKTAYTQRVAATTDEKHILGVSEKAVSDIVITGEQPACTPIAQQTTDVNFASTVRSFNFTGVTPSIVDTATQNDLRFMNVVPSNNSAIAFVTFQGASNGKVPYYLPNTGTGVLNYLTLNNSLGTVTAPVAGVFSTDNFTFYLGTAGDNAVHVISLTYPSSGAPTVTDGTPIKPGLPSATTNGATAVPNMIVQRPRRVNS